jgi:signal transduction histidine kinase
VRLTVGDHARLCVRDAGPATAPRADGLGLRLVRQVTEHGLHGTFTLEPDPDGSTRADVRFPLVDHARADR